MSMKAFCGSASSYIDGPLHHIYIWNCSPAIYVENTDKLLHFREQQFFICCTYELQQSVIPVP